MENSVPGTLHPGHTLASIFADNGEPLDAADIFAYSIMDEIMDSSTSMEQIDGIRKLLAKKPVHVPSRRRKQPPASTSARHLCLTELEQRWSVNTTVTRQAQSKPLFLPPILLSPIYHTVHQFFR